MHESEGWVVWEGNPEGGLAAMDQVRAEAIARLREADSWVLVSVSKRVISEGAVEVEPDLVVGTQHVPREAFLAAALLSIGHIAGAITDEEDE